MSINLERSLSNKTITIAFCGKVSVGKSTLLSSIFGNVIAPSGLNRTTFIPQIYEEVSNLNHEEGINIYDMIYAKAKEANQKVGQNKIVNSNESQRHYIPINQVLINNNNIKQYQTESQQDMKNNNLKDYSKLEVYDLCGIDDSLDEQINILNI